MGVDCSIISVAPDDVPAETALPAGVDDLARYHDDRSEMLDRLYENPTCHLGKAWDAIHVALGRHRGDHPLAFLETGGSNVAALDDGISGHANYFDAATVLAIAQALEAVTAQDVHRNFALRDSVDPDELYPRGLSPFKAGDIMPYVRQIRRFLADVVAAKRGIIVHTSG